MNDKQAIQSLSALAQINRLQIFRFLVRHGPSGQTAGEIAHASGLSATSTSFHLKELEHAGLVSATREGRFIRYAVHVEGMRSLITFLTEDCCQGQPDLCGSDISKTDKICKPQKTLKIPKLKTQKVKR